METKRPRMETYKEKCDRIHEEYEARRVKYAAIMTMKEMQEYVQNHVAERTMVDKVPIVNYGEETRGKLRLGKTTMLRPRDFDKEIIARAAELYIQTQPDLLVTISEKKAQMATEVAKNMTLIQQYLRLREEMDNMTKQLTDVFGPRWEEKVDRYVLDGQVSMPGRVYEKLCDEVTQIEQAAARKGFMEMLATAQKGRTKVTLESLDYM
jgi:hypothetical protein